MAQKKPFIVRIEPVERQFHSFSALLVNEKLYLFSTKESPNGAVQVLQVCYLMAN
jgi:hypothetical protein